MHLKRQMANLFILSFMAACLFLISFALPVHADPYYVDITDGTDQAGCGPQGSPCRTLHYTISTFVDGDDTVYMAAGTYNIANEGDSSLVITNNNVTIQGDTDGNTIIDGYSTGEPVWTTGIEIDSATDVTIQNITIKNFQSAGIYIDNCSPDIKKNKLVDNLKAIHIYNNSSSAIGPSIINNLIYEETSNAMQYGIHIESWNTGSDSYPIIHHNTIDGGWETGILVDEDVTTTEPIIKYNIITSFGEYGIRYNGSQNPVIDYNLLFDHTESNYDGITGGSNDIINQDDPLYEDPSAHDYNLQSASPCIDAIPSSEADISITDDLDENQRPSPTNGDYDMGCYEFQQETPPADNQPATPTNEYPPDYYGGFPDTTTSVTLESSAFSDPNGNTHTSTEWLVRREDRGVYNCDDYDATFNATYTSDPGLTSHEVLGLVSGMQYVWKVRYQNSNEIWSLWSEEYRFTVGTSAQDSSVQLIGSTDVASYRMVSFPLWPGNPDCSAFFSNELGGSYDTTQLRLGTYMAQTGSYLECSSDMTIKPGRSYWFLSKNDMDIGASGIPVATGLDVEIGLQYNESTGNGWNMIACPNNANYNWLSVEVLVSDGSGGTIFGPTPVSDLTDDNLYIDTSLWRWEDGSYLDDTQTLEHHEGYWVNARAENVYLRFRSDLTIADSGQQRTVFSAYAKAFTKIKKWIAGVIDTRHAVASDETPPLPPGVHDEPETKSCFIHTAFD